MFEIHIFISLSLSFPGKLRANLITSPKLVSDPFMGFRKPGKFCLWNQKSWALESGIQLKESGIPLTIGIRNPSSTDKYWNPVSEIWTDPRRRIQNLRLSWISLHGMIIVFFPASIFLDVLFFFASSTVMIFFTMIMIMKNNTSTVFIFCCFSYVLSTDVEDNFPSHHDTPDFFFPIAQADITECSTYAVVCRLKSSPPYTITPNGGSFSHPDYPGVIINVPKKAVRPKAKFPLELKVGTSVS